MVPPIRARNLSLVASGRLAMRRRTLESRTLARTMISFRGNRGSKFADYPSRPIENLRSRQVWTLGL